MDSRQHGCILAFVVGYDWGCAMRPLVEWTDDLDGAYKAFRQHCVERHGLSEDGGGWIQIDIVKWTMELVRD
jgi:hypothetical protein